MRRIAEQVVRDHDERSLTGAVLPVPDRDAVVAELVARMSGFGPLQRYVDDPTVDQASAKPRGGNALSCRHVGESPAGRQAAERSGFADAWIAAIECGFADT